MKWEVHISDVIKKATGHLFMLTTLRRFGLPLEDLRTIYIGFIRPLVEYAVPAWHPGLSEIQHYALERVQKRACKIILGNKYISYQNAVHQCNLTESKARRDQICVQFANKLLETPKFRSWLPCFRGEKMRCLRNATTSPFPRCVPKGMLRALFRTWSCCGIRMLQQFDCSHHAFVIGISAILYVALCFFVFAIAKYISLYVCRQFSRLGCYVLVPCLINTGAYTHIV